PPPYQNDCLNWCHYTCECHTCTCEHRSNCWMQWLRACGGVWWMILTLVGIGFIFIGPALLVSLPCHKIIYDTIGIDECVIFGFSVEIFLYPLIPLVWGILIDKKPLKDYLIHLGISG